MVRSGQARTAASTTETCEVRGAKCDVRTAPRWYFEPRTSCLAPGLLGLILLCIDDTFRDGPSEAGGVDRRVTG